MSPRFRIPHRYRYRYFLWLGRYADKHVRPNNIPAYEKDDLFFPHTYLSDVGLRFDDEKQRQLLSRWGREYSDIFREMKNDKRLNPLGDTAHIENAYFNTPDAETYAAMIADYRPFKIVEVGSGFSTIAARWTVNHLGLSTPIIAIDPEPRTDVSGMVDSLLQKGVEHVKLSELGDMNHTLFFIDSSHICRAGGDLPNLYCNILPQLPTGSLIHIHDIFLPYDYPPVYWDWLYTEQYLVFCMLSQSERYEILYASHYMYRSHLREVRETFGNKFGNNNTYTGTSIWLSIK